MDDGLIVFVQCLLDSSKSVRELVESETGNGFYDVLPQYASMMISAAKWAMYSMKSMLGGDHKERM